MMGKLGQMVERPCTMVNTKATPRPIYMTGSLKKEPFSPVSSRGMLIRGKDSFSFSDHCLRMMELMHRKV